MILYFNQVGISFVKGGQSPSPECDSRPLAITFSVEDGLDYRYYYDTDTSKWYIKNDQGSYEEYGVYTASSATTYEGKLVISDGYEYEWDGTQWVNLGEVGGSLPKTYPSIDTYENWADSEFNYPETFNTQDSKWWVKNNQNHYEEYGVYADSIDSGVTTYEGKLALIPVDSGSTVDEYEYSGGTWNYLGSGSAIPYTEVEYLQTTKNRGTGINTDIKIGGTTVFRGKVMFDGYIGNMLFGTRGSSNPASSDDNNDWRIVKASPWGGNATFDIKNKRSNYFSLTQSQWYNLEVGNNYVKDLDTDTYIYSGTSVDTSWNSGCDFILFLAYTGGHDYTDDAGKIGPCQIYNNGVLVRDLVPCKDENDVPCFYDKVSEGYFRSFTSVDPIAGPEVGVAGSLPKEYTEKDAPDTSVVAADIYCDLYQDSAITVGNYIGREAVVLDEAAVYKVNSGKKWEYLYPISNTLTYTTTDGELIESIPASGWGANLLANIVLEGDNTLIFDTAPTSMPAMSGQTKLVGMELPEELTSIPADGFNGCTALRSIDIPAGVTSIGDNAFRGCTSITGMTLPSGLTSIGQVAFYDCSGLTSIDIPSGVTSLPYAVFYNCKSLSSITMPVTLTSIGHVAFSHCSALSSVTLPSGLISIGESAFEYCSNITTITMPDTVTSIGSSAFQGCTNLTGITVPSGVTTVQNKTFSGCTSLSSITFNGNVTRFNEDAFRYCAFSSITIPDTVTYMGKSVFEGCRNMTEIHIGSGVTSLPVSFVYACSGLTTVDWGSNCRVTSIGQAAFIYCRALSSITIPETVTSISNYAFNDCSSLSAITAYPTVAPSIGSSFDNVVSVGTLYVPANADYSTWLAKLPSGWSIVRDVAPLAFTNTGNTAADITLDNVSGNTPNVEYSTDGSTWTTWDYSTITIPAGDTVYFRGTNPTGFNHGTSATTTSYSSFSGTTGSLKVSGNLESLIDYQNETFIGAANDKCFTRLFYYNHNITDASDLDLHLTTIQGVGYYAGMFSHCDSLVKAPSVMPATALTYQCYRDCFIECTALEEVPATLPATTLTEDCYHGMFATCTSLETAPKLPAATLVNTCYMSMFNGCSSLSAITMLATDITATDCLKNWVLDVAATGTFVKNSSMTTLPTGASGIPSGWTVQDWTLENFLFNINAKNYDVTTKTFANTSGASFTSAFTMNSAPAEVGSDYLQLSGNSIIFDFVSTAANPFNMDASKSMTLIFKVDVPSTNIYDGNIFCNRNNSQYNWMARIEGTSPNQVYYFHDGSGIHMTNTNINQYTAPYTIASVLSGTNCTSYFWNGTQWVTVTQSGAGWSIQSNKFSLFYETADGVYFNCKFYWAYIADRALTLSEIQDVVTFNDL